MNREEIKRIPKVELHCHLDGSISLPALRKMAAAIGAELAEDKVGAPVPCHSLAQYLECFGVVLPLLQTREALELAAYDVLRQAAEENVLYQEIRFAPAFHCNAGLSEEDACGAVLRGLERGEQDFGVKSRALLCMMRGNSEEQNRRTLECARSLLGYGVGGLDLAGDEASYPTRMYRELFDRAVHYDIPFTLHSGECQSAENVRDAVEMGASRIGHGVAVADNEPVRELCRKSGTCFEVCPISNLQTKAVARLEDYPFLKMKEAGLRVTVNTDNRTVSGTTLTKEWETLSGQFPSIGAGDLLDAAVCAAESAFLPAGERQALVEKIRSFR